MARYAAQSGQPLDYIPETYIVSAKLQFGNEKDRLFAAEAAAQDAGRGTVWIVKPNGQNRGIGIGVVNSMGVRAALASVPSVHVCKRACRLACMYIVDALGAHCSVMCLLSRSQSLCLAHPL